MLLSTQLQYGDDPITNAEAVVGLEKAGLDVVWVAEAYSYDAVSLMGYLAARTERVQIGSGILPIYSRTPTLTAMTAAGLDALSGGRTILGLGASGPQVIEGFHGVPYDKPVARTREIIEICRQVWRRERIQHEGLYSIPLPPGQGTGLGKPLKLINHPRRADIPVWVAALGDKNLEMTAELAHGWLPHAVLPIFEDWLTRNRPLQKDRVLGRIRDVRDGKLTDRQWGRRLTGHGLYAEQIAKTFAVFKKRYGLDGRLPELDTSQFRAPQLSGGQMRLF